MSIYISMGYGEGAVGYTTNILEEQDFAPQGLLDSAGESTGITISGDGTWSGVSSANTLTGNDAGYLADALYATFFYAQAQTPTFTLSGLDPAKTYRLRISATRDATTEDRVTSATIGAVTHEYITSHANGDPNFTEGATFNDLSADSNGEILISFGRVEGAYQYVSGIIIDAYDRDSTLSTLDIFNDGSGVFCYPLDNTTNGLDNVYTPIATSGNIGYSAEGKFGQALNSSTADMWFNTGYTQPALTEYSFSVWTRGAVANLWQFILVDETNNQDDTARFIIGLSSSNNFYIGFGDGVSEWTDTSVDADLLLDNEYHHLVVSVNGTTVKLYVDKVLIHTYTSTVSAGTAGTHPYYIGCAGDNENYTWSGDLDQARFISKEVTQAEVDILFTEVGDDSTVGINDIFEDGSIIATYSLDDTIQDLAGTYNATVGVGVEAYTPAGKFGSGMVVGNNWSINTGYIAGGSSTRSYSVWARGTSLGAYHFFLGNEGDIQLGVWGSELVLDIQYLADGETQQKQVTLPEGTWDDTWRHIVVTFSATTLIVYLDKVLILSTPVSGDISAPSTEPLALGSYLSTADDIYGWTGDLDQVRLFNRVVTQAEVDILFNEQPPITEVNNPFVGLAAITAMYAGLSPVAAVYLGTTMVYEPPHIPEIQNFLIIGASIVEATLNPTDTKALMDATYPNSNCTVYNEAVGGWKTADLASNIDSILATYTGSITEMVVLMHIGGGNITTNRPYSADPQLVQMQEDLDYIISAVAAAGYTMYMADNTYRDYADVETNNEINGSGAYNDNMMNPTVPNGYKFEDGQSWCQFYTVFYNDILVLNGDGVHPLDPYGEVPLRQRFVDTVGYHNFTGREPTRFPKTDFYVVPNAVTSTSLQNSAQSVTVSWVKDNINVYSYNIYKNSNLIDSVVIELGADDNYSIIDDASVENNTTVTYEVRAVNDTGESTGNLQPTIFIPEIVASTGPIYDISLNDNSTTPSQPAPSGITINDIAGINEATSPTIILDNDGVDNESITIESIITGSVYDSASQGSTTGDDSGYLYDRQLVGAWYFYDTAALGFEVAGLEVGAKYDFYLMSSRADNKTDRHIVFTCGSEAPITIDAMYNTANGATFMGVEPDVDGKVVIGGTVLTDDLIAYFNGFRIQKRA